MIDHDAWRKRMRQHMMTLVVADTGVTDLEVTATGFKRAAGSFITDGFAEGMELVASGFGGALNGYHTITDQVDDLTMACYGCSVLASAPGRRLVVGLPERQAWENVDLPEDTLPLVRPFFEEQYVPGPSDVRTMGVRGMIIAEPMYSPRVHVKKGIGTTAIDRYVGKMIELFAPKTALILANGDILRVRADQNPFPGQLRQEASGHAVVPVTFPFRIETANTL